MRHDACFLGKWHQVCRESELKHPFNVGRLPRIWRLHTWDSGFKVGVGLVVGWGLMESRKGGRAGERKGGREEKQIPFPCSFLLLLWTQVETNLAACPSKGLLAPVPSRLGATLHLYMSSSVIKGSQLLLSFPTSPVQLLCWLTMPVLICDSSFIHFQLAKIFFN